MTDGQKLVSFLDGIMAQHRPMINIDNSIKKDATEKEMESYCKEYMCDKCPILQRCSMAANMFNVEVDPFI